MPERGEQYASYAYSQPLDQKKKKLDEHTVPGAVESYAYVMLERHTPEGTRSIIWGGQRGDFLTFCDKNTSVLTHTCMIFTL